MMLLDLAALDLEGLDLLAMAVSSGVVHRWFRVV
jgi:hypothetical protein